MYQKYLLGWFGIMVLAILNGSIREMVYLHKAGYIAAHQISTTLLLILISVGLWILTGRWRLETARSAWTVGLLWFGLTLTFEFGFGRYIAGRPWEHLLFEYNLAAGRIWVLVPLWMLFAPPIMRRLRIR
ncbi:MAG: hypothetical protein HY962_00820 [Ignavibacteriae bacterium]|nr:hypothetical protein [Ignavibacteriota bacterium]